MTTVTCVGLAVQDFVFTMPERLIEGEKNFASSLVASGGGPAATAAVTASRLGADARLVTAVGADVVGDAVIAELESYEVDCRPVRRVVAPTSMSTVLVAPDGERTVVNSTDPDLWSGAELPQKSDLAGSDLILVDVRWPIGAQAAVTIAHKAGIPTVVDCDATDAAVSEAVLFGADTIIFAEPAMGAYGLAPTGKGVTEAANRWGGVVAVTKGSEGVVWSDGGGVESMPAFQIEAVDTLGAGDVFHGAFATGVARGMDLRHSFRLASAAAAIRCIRGGGRTGIPSQDDIDRFIEVQS